MRVWRDAGLAMRVWGRGPQRVQGGALVSFC